MQRYTQLAPLAFVLGVLGVESSRYLSVAEHAHDAARSAARHASMNDVTPDAVYGHVEDFLIDVGVAKKGIVGIQMEYAVTQSTPGAMRYDWTQAQTTAPLPEGTPLRATVAINYNRLSWLPLDAILGRPWLIMGKCVEPKLISPPSLAACGS